MDLARFRPRSFVLLALGALALSALLVGGCAAPSDSEKASFATVVVNTTNTGGAPVAGVPVVLLSAENWFPIVPQAFTTNAQGQAFIQGVPLNAATPVVLTVAVGPEIRRIVVTANGQQVTVVPTGAFFLVSSDGTFAPTGPSLTIPLGEQRILTVEAVVNGNVVPVTSANYSVVSGANVISLTSHPSTPFSTLVTALNPGVATVQATIVAGGSTFTPTLTVLVPQAGPLGLQFAFAGQPVEQSVALVSGQPGGTLVTTVLTNGVPVTPSNITYQVVSGANVIRLVGASGNQVQIQPIQPGVATILVTAKVGSQTQTALVNVIVVHPQGHLQGGGSGS